MPDRFAFIYFMKDAPEKIRELVPYHVEYWNGSNVEGCIGGPFSDRTGGLISFQSTNLAEAVAIVDADPFVVHGLLEGMWVKEWVPVHTSRETE